MPDTSTLIERAHVRAESIAREGQSLLNSAVTAARSSLEIGDIDYPEVPDMPDDEIDFEIPDFNNQVQLPDLDVDDPDYLEEEISAIDDGTEYPDSPEISLDGLFSHDKPNGGQIDQFNGLPPSINIDGISSELSGLASLSLDTISEPTLSTNRTIRDVPSINIPLFDSSVSVDQVEAPTDSSETYEEAYNRMLPQMQQFIDNKLEGWVAEYAPTLKSDISCLQEKIESIVKGESTALGDKFETELLNRARSTASIEAMRVQSELENNQSKRGFKLPSGSLLSGRLTIEQAVADNLSKQAIEYSIQRRTAEVQHLQFAMSLSLQSQQMLLGNALAWAQISLSNGQQALGYAKDVAVQLVETYNLRLRRAESQRAEQLNDIKIFEAELQSSLSVYEGYKLELEAANLDDKRDDQKIRLYESKIRASGQKIQNSARAIDAIYKKAQIEKIKTDLFQSTVNAYLGRVKTVEAELGVYNAALKGDESLLKGRLAEVDIFEKETDIAIAKQEIKLKKLNSINAINSNKTQRFQARISKFQIELKAQLDQHGINSDVYSKQLQKVAVEIALTKDVYKNKRDAIVAVSEIAKQKAEYGLKRVELNAELFTEKTRLLTDTSVAVGRLFADMAAAQMNANHTMVSQSSNE